MSARLTIGLSDAFPETLALKISTAGVRPVDAVEELLIEILGRSLASSPTLSLLKTPAVKIHSMYYKDRCATLAQLAREGYATWYVELAFSTALENAMERLDVDATGLELRPISYWVESYAYRLSTKKLKRQANHTLRLNHVIVPPNIFADTLRALEEMPALEQPYVANFRPGPRSQGFEHGIEGFGFVSFDHVITGERLFCSCARVANEKMRATASGIVRNYAAGSWPHQVTELISDVPYKDEVCHLCVARRSGSESAGLLYGDAVQDFVPSYIDQLMLAGGIDKATARTEVQHTLGLSRWLREAEMYSIAKKLFPDQVIMREASPSWLGRQRLDVFIPALNLALEHQGQQHYSPVTAFGGDEALKRGLERDAAKRRLCEENGVHLVDIRFDEPLTLPALRQRLRRYVQPA
ncbi:hypothetical protein [Rhizobium leguminosarum]|uniref:hypothetical protein n=1 Tax=Rhizobium leguminosarum TaxID=384 RepID=UPI00102FC460|nr:hypothetical protein [Rhizobium leguminosarum]TAY14014.1 hypothetical protein ELH96_20665 [Rhizobium leguminosarum]